MTKDATPPQPSFYSDIASSFAKVTHFIDENIRVIQYAVYCTGAVGIVVCLRSVRAFTKFTCIQDIPREFITNHVRLHGHVKWIGLSPPIPTEASHTPPLLPLTGNDLPKSSKISDLTSSISEKSSNTDRSNGNENMNHETPKTLSEDNYAISKDTSQLPWDCNPDPDVTRIEYNEDVIPVYLQVDHTAVVQFSKKKTTSLLPLQLADVEVSKDGFQLMKRELMNQRVWFTITSHDMENGHLNAWVRPAKLFHRSINARLLRTGLALVAPMDLNLFNDHLYVKQYMNFMKAQEYAQNKELGLWKPEPKPLSSTSKIFRMVISKLRSLLGKSSGKDI